MAQYISKAALVAEINKRIMDAPIDCYGHQRVWAYNDIKDIIDTLEVIDPYELWVQYPNVKDAIQAHAEDYSFNIESELFNQLTKEQQKLWRKEIEQACISGGYSGLNLVKDPRYKENLEVKEVDLDTEQRRYLTKHFNVYDDGILQSKKSQLPLSTYDVINVAKHFFELGLKAKKGEGV